MQGSTSIMAEADPAVLRQPTAAEQRLDTSLKQQRSNGAACAAYSVAVPLVTQSSTVGGFATDLLSSLVLTDHMCSSQVLKSQRSVISPSQMTLWDGATMCNYPACKKAQVTSCRAPSPRSACMTLMTRYALPLSSIVNRPQIVTGRGAVVCRPDSGGADSTESGQVGIAG